MLRIFPLTLAVASCLANPVFAEETNIAMQRADCIVCQLGWPDLSDEERIHLQDQYWNLLTETGPETAAYGSITGGPILKKCPSGLPSISVGPNVIPAATAWQKTKNYTPTNDWLENIAAHPTTGKNSDDGFSNITVDANGMKFNFALNFYDWGPVLHSMIQISSWDPGYKLGALGYAKPFSLQWDLTGNIVRKAVYDEAFSIYLAQGSLFHGAAYAGAIPDTGFTLTNTMKSILADGTVKYKVVKTSAIYLIYANGQFVPGMPYTGNLNVAAIPNNAQAASFESLCDAHAQAVIVKGQATLLPNGTYSFQYLCEDLQKQPTAIQPLVLLKAHHAKSLCCMRSLRDTGISLFAITGPVKIFKGSTYIFQPKTPRSIEPAPNLPNGGAPLTRDQSLLLTTSGGPLDQEIARILNKYKSSTTVYEGGKVDYQIALTLDYGTKAIEIAGMPIDRMMPLYQRLRTILSNKLYLYLYDTLYSGIVAKTNDYGNYSDYNDHIVQYGYDLLSFAILKAFEDRYLPTDQRLMNKQVSLAGYETFTYNDMADFLASDMGELSRHNNVFPVMRNLDTYIGHSWLSGLGSKNTESQSEAVIGAWSVAYWLKVRGAPADQLGTALTRFALETESLNTYNHIGDAATSVFNPIAPVYVAYHPVVSITWGNGKLGAETYWGLQWDRIFACEFMPASANGMDTMLDFHPTFAKRGADYVLANWADFDTGNAIQSTLIPIVSKTYGAAQSMTLIDDVASRNFFDSGTNAFILRYTAYYADNQLH